MATGSTAHAHAGHVEMSEAEPSIDDRIGALKLGSDGTLVEVVLAPDKTIDRLALKKASDVLSGNAAGVARQPRDSGRVVRRPQEIRRIEKRVLDFELTVAHRLNPPRVDCDLKIGV